MRYCLADYIVSITPSDSTLRSMFSKVTIGGEGNAIDSITISRSTNMWSTEGFATGAWVHNKSLDRTGTVQLSLSQLSEKISKLKKMCEVFYNGDYSGFTITVTDSKSNVVASCNDCYLVKIPTQTFGNSAGTQSWTFTCGEVDFK